MKRNFLYTLKYAPIAALVTIGICVLTTVVASLLGRELPDQANVDFVKRCAGWNVQFLLVVLHVVVIMPIIEETIFRGILFRWIKPGRLWLAALTSSMLFAAAHYLDQPWPDNAFLALFFFGLAQCRLYQKTGAIGYPMLNHAFFNVLNLVLLFVLPV